jgi:redox-sensitive bicupin YhaK (pirin superfamily)
VISLRRGADRGHANHGWLDTHHTFSFADYHDERFMGFRDLRVLNEDRVAAGRGFPTHSHNDMEILSWVLEGELEHRDSMGNGSIIRPGELQRMSAGTGVRHSERNPSASNPLHFLQIWILPDRDGLPPEYEQTAFPESERQGRLREVASPDGRDGSLTIHQDVRLYVADWTGNETVTHDLEAGRYAWIHAARGSLSVNGTRLEAGDGAAVSAEKRLELVGSRGAEVLLFDLV